MPTNIYILLTQLNEATNFNYHDLNFRKIINKMVFFNKIRIKNLKLQNA
jgi:hypothetical protein